MNPFKKETAKYESLEALTPYQRAQAEWDGRMGSAIKQASGWRMVAFFLLLIIALLIGALLFLLKQKGDKVFVAEVTREGRVVNISSLPVQYRPTVAQYEYFITHFIELARALPLDPVVARNNWLNAYNFLTQRGAMKLNAILREHNPLELLGKKTITVKILDINPLSGSSFEVDWSETTINANGQNEGEREFSGVFTTLIKQPASQEEILKNPLGIYIIDFNFSTRTREK